MFDTTIVTKRSCTSLRRVMLPVSQTFDYRVFWQVSVRYPRVVHFQMHRLAAMGASPTNGTSWITQFCASRDWSWVLVCCMNLTVPQKHMHSQTSCRRSRHSAS